MQKMSHRLTEELKRLAYENHDNCVNCGYEFVDGDRSHLGYDENEEPLYVCDGCASELKETAVRHRFSPRPYEIPQSDSYLWRYMDFTKYVSLLSTAGLYFARSDTFEDPFEGAKGTIENKGKWDKYYLDFFKHVMRHPPEGSEWDQSEENVEKEARRLLKELEVGGHSHRESVYISCWHENEHESKAMWRLYSNFLDNAIAIRTTYSSLYKALDKNPSISIGKVKYIDFSQSYAGPNDSFWRKRKSFEHEREVRAIVRDHKSEELGKILSCDLRTLVEEIIVSPTAPPWFVSVLEDVNSKFGLNVTVSRSNLNEVPFF
ncbi:hypothetical protein [Vibrio splendidus]|uniref:hypothetical protein n=1 Tax=Vibrio splendidus TaxID=29497 RepID=UPI001F530276|nr:hypothetical protein [Vibrio splendidus]